MIERPNGRKMPADPVTLCLMFGTIMFLGLIVMLVMKLAWRL
jgi:hypothetical protein